MKQSGASEYYIIQEPEDNSNSINLAPTALPMHCGINCIASFEHILYHKHSLTNIHSEKVLTPTKQYNSVHDTNTFILRSIKCSVSKASIAMARAALAEHAERRLPYASVGRCEDCTWLSSSFAVSASTLKHALLAPSGAPVLRLLISTAEDIYISSEHSIDLHCSPASLCSSASETSHAVDAALVGHVDGSISCVHVDLQKDSEAVERSNCIHGKRSRVHVASAGAVGVSVHKQVVFHDLQRIESTFEATKSRENTHKTACAMAGSQFAAVTAGASAGVQMWDCRKQGEAMRLSLPYSCLLNHAEVITCLHVARHDECIVAAGTNYGSAVLWDARRAHTPISWCPGAVSKRATAIRLDSSGRIGTAASAGMQPLPAIVASTSGQVTRVEWKEGDTASAAGELIERDPVVAMDVEPRNGPHILHATSGDEVVHTIAGT